MRMDVASSGRRAAIGRQIVLPFSKAFEIAWKGIRIRVWRSLITMSGIILAIAFLVSVWAADIFSRSLAAVPESDKLYPIVQGALEAQAIAAGGLRLSCAVVGAEAAGEGRVSPTQAAFSYLTEQEGIRAQQVLPTARSLRELLAGAETRPNALVMVGIPSVGDDVELIRTFHDFVAGGGRLIIYGTAGADSAPAWADLLPARLAEGTFTATGPGIRRNERAPQLHWQNHPTAAFRRTEGKPGAMALAFAGDGALAWLWDVEQGSVAWYVADETSAADADVISWFVRGQTAQAGGEAGLSPIMRLLARGLGGERSDMRGLWLVTLSLMVCVVGITNAMLMSVTERFREIGTMKCLGALDKFVVKLFLIESSLQGAAGSLVGAVIGFLLAFVRALFTFHASDPETGRGYWLVLRYFPILPLLSWVGLALVVGLVLSIIAAIYPAIRAARMEPVQAMRVEA